MISMKFRCRLLSDVIFHSQSVVEQLQRTTDFIPGNTFLGIMAKKYDEYSESMQMLLFHSGKVRFGDAHPVNADGNTRSLKIPAAMYYPKLKGMDGGCYIHHVYNRAKDKEDGGVPQQLKQCRNGFYVFNKEQHEMSQVILDKTLSLKSSYNRERRASEDGKMYINESMRSGATFLFDVESDDENLKETIIKGLSGIHFVGRSRTAQFGRVLIEPYDYSDVLSTSTISDDSDITVYADGRLIFFDDNGSPTFRPTAEQLGISNGQIDWSKSQIRTFQYAPWNGKRYSCDTDRCGIEKGSVFVVHVTGTPTDLSSRYVGNYQNEGFGKVIYNPEFLLADPSTNGKSLYKVGQLMDTKEETKNEMKVEGVLMNFLLKEQRRDNASFHCYELVNQFINRYAEAFYDPDEKGTPFSSQWGEIREIAQKGSNTSSILTSIESFVNKTTFREKKWKENNRYDKLKSFINNVSSYLNDEIGGDDLLVKETIMNLANEMAKKNRDLKNKKQ